MVVLATVPLPFKVIPFISNLYPFTGLMANCTYSFFALEVSKVAATPSAAKLRLPVPKVIVLLATAGACTIPLP